MSVQGVALRDDAGHAGTPLDLLPSEQRGERELVARAARAAHRSSARSLLLLFVALVFPVYQKRETFIALNPLVNKARQEAEATDAHRARARAPGGRLQLPPRAQARHAIRRSHSSRSSRGCLPDNTWVQQLDVKTTGKTREVQIIGETASASKLIEILEGSTLLQNAAFRGTVTRGSHAGHRALHDRRRGAPAHAARIAAGAGLVTVMRRSRRAAAVPRPRQSAPPSCRTAVAQPPTATVDAGTRDRHRAPKAARSEASERHRPARAPSEAAAGSSPSRCSWRAVLLAIAAIVVIPFWLLHRHYDTALADSLDKLDRYQRIASTRPVVAKQLEAMRAKDTQALLPA